MHTDGSRVVAEQAICHRKCAGVGARPASPSLLGGVAVKYRVHNGEGRRDILYGAGSIVPGGKQPHGIFDATIMANSGTPL